MNLILMLVSLFIPATIFVLIFTGIILLIVNTCNAKNEQPYSYVPGSFPLREQKAPVDTQEVIEEKTEEQKREEAEAERVKRNGPSKSELEHREKIQKLLELKEKDPNAFYEILNEAAKKKNERSTERENLIMEPVCEEDDDYDDDRETEEEEEFWLNLEMEEKRKKDEEWQAEIARIEEERKEEEERQEEEDWYDELINYWYE